MTKPVKQEVTYFKDRRPEKFQFYHLKKSIDDNNICLEDEVHRRNVKKPSSSSSDNQRIIRTVILPNEQVDSLKLTIESLQAQMEEMVIIIIIY